MNESIDPYTDMSHDTVSFQIALIIRPDFFYGVIVIFFSQSRMSFSLFYISMSNYEPPSHYIPNFISFKQIDAYPI